MRETVAIPVTETSQVGEARRAAASLATRLGFGEAEQGRAALVVTEMATNLAKHADGGEILLQPSEAGGQVTLQALALDRGPGMEHVDRCLEDGFSTAGSPGTGLGAIRRVADRFEFHSLPGVGTALLAAIGRAAKQPLAAGGEGSAPLQVGGVCVPVAGERVSGDGWLAAARDGRTVVLVVDGLGHGPTAAEAAEAGLRVLERTLDRPPREILEAAHQALRSTRGAAAAVAEIVPEGQVVRYAGVGNIAAQVVTLEGSRSLVSGNGIVGHQAHRIQEFSYPWSRGAVLVMHSDGLATRWDLARYPGLLRRHPALVAGTLYRDHRRGRDDVTVVAVREGIL